MALLDIPVQSATRLLLGGSLALVLYVRHSIPALLRAATSEENVRWASNYR
jgi:hypothetical protein